MSARLTRPAAYATAAVLAWLLQTLAGLRIPLRPDEQQMFEEAVSGRYSDWHSPIISATWRLLNLIDPAAWPMLVLQFGLGWLGLALFAQGLRHAGRPVAAWLMLGIGVFPMILLFNVTVAKEPLMAGPWLIALSLVWIRRSAPAGDAGRPRRWLLLALALLVYGMLARVNAVFAIGAPLAWLLAARPERLTLVRLAIASVLGAVLTLPLAGVVNQQLLGAHPTGALRSLQVFDLAGIAVRTGDASILPADSAFDLAAAERCYTPYWWDPFSDWGPCAAVAQSLGFGPRIERAAERSLTGTWVGAIARHPFAYAAHRVAHFNALTQFAVPARHQRFAWLEGPKAAAPGEVLPMGRRLGATALAGPWTWPACWIALAVGLLVVVSSASARPDPLVRPLLVSALSYAGAYLVIGVAGEMRYFYWTTMAVLLSAVLAWPALAQVWSADRRRVWRAALPLCVVTAIGLTTRLADVTWAMWPR